MSEQRKRFDDAQAFFLLFTRSPWKSCHVRTDAMEIFASRDRGAVNPMSVVAGIAPAANSAAFRAPHLGTLVAIADIGARLSIGQPYGQIELLGERIDILAEADGVVSAHLNVPGTLVEYDQPLLRLSLAN